MRRWIRSLATSLMTLAFVTLAEVIYLGWCNGRSLVTQPLALRRPMLRDPADFDLAYEEVSVITSDDVTLHGWFIPGTNGATIIAQHGYRGDRTDLLFEAAFLNDRGYNVLLSSVRGHDLNEEEHFTFGKRELRDMEAWFDYLVDRSDVDPERVGILGESFGGALAIRYAAERQQVRAVATVSTYADIEDTMDGVRNVFEKQGMPGWLADVFTPIIVNAAETNADFRVEELDTVGSIGALSPRPVLIAHGGQDEQVAPSSGAALFEAAGQPKSYWFEPEARHNFCDHVAFHHECARRLLSFFDTYLLNP